MTKSKLVGTDLLIYVNVHDALIGLRLGDDTAGRYSIFAVQLYREVSARPALQEELKILYKSGKEAYPALKQWYRATGMAAPNGVRSGYLKLAGKDALRGAGNEVAGFFEIATALAKANNIQMNECALAITKVMLDILSGIGMAGTVVGVWAAAFFALSAVHDARGMMDACFGPR